MATKPASRNARTLRLHSFVGIALFAHGGTRIAEPEGNMSTRSLIVWLIALLAWPQLAAAAPSYAVTPWSGKYTSAVDLNNAGQIAVNNLDTNVPYRTGYIQGNNTSESVGTLGGSDSRIVRLNNHGEAVGYSTTASGATHAFSYSGGRIEDLTAAYGMDIANGVNDQGDIAGRVDGHAALLHAGGMVDVFGPADSGAGPISNSGNVAGDYLIEGVGTHAFLYSKGKFADLGTLGGTFTVANAVNDAGAVVGYGSIGVGQYHAFLYDDCVMTDLGPAAASSMANDINNLGQVVGTIDGRAFLYANGKMTDLNTLIAPDSDFLLVAAVAINDRQQILVNACDRTGTFCTSSVRLDPIAPIPEPGSIGMLLAGSVLLGVHRYSQRRRTSA